MALHYVSPATPLTLHYENAPGRESRAPVLAIEVSVTQREVTGWIVVPFPDHGAQTLRVDLNQVRRIEGIGDRAHPGAGFTPVSTASQ